MLVDGPTRWTADWAIDGPAGNPVIFRGSPLLCDLACRSCCRNLRVGSRRGPVSGLVPGNESNRAPGETSGHVLGETSGYVLGETSGHVLGETSGHVLGDESGDVTGGRR